MPRKSVEYLQAALDGPDFMIPASEGDVQTMSMINALRAAADGMKRLTEQQDAQSADLKDLVNVLHSVDKRLSIIEANSVASTVAEHGRRLTALENVEERRKGAVGLWDFVLKSWPAVVAFVALLAALIATGKI